MIEQSLRNMQERVRKALMQYPIASLTILRGAVQSNHRIVQPATASLLSTGEILRLPADPFTHQAERVYLAKSREALSPFLIGEVGRDYRRPFYESDDLYARDRAENLGKIVEALNLYPILTRWALSSVLSSDWSWVEPDLIWLQKAGIVATYIPRDGDKRRVPRYFLAQYAETLAMFLGGRQGEKEAVLQGA